MLALAYDVAPDGWSGYGGPLSNVGGPRPMIAGSVTEGSNSGFQVASWGVAGFAVDISLPDCGDRSPKVPVVLVVPHIDQGVRRSEVEQCEQARAVRHVEGQLVNEPASNRVVVRRGIRL